jgi:multidrug efflux system membrane fusion protein
MKNLQNIVLRRSPYAKVALVIVALLLLWWIWHAIFGGAAQQSKPVASVRVAPVIARDMPVLVRTIGTVRANATVQIKSRTDGQIIEVAFREGQLVKEGDLLFRIDPKPYEAALREAEAALARDEAQLTNARLNLNRASLLMKKGYTSVQARDAAAAEAKALAGSVAGDRAAVDRAKLQLDYTEIKSPIDGKTGSVLVDKGNLVKANDTASLVVVTQLQPVKISFALPQQNLPQLQARIRDKALFALLDHQDVSGRNDEPAIQAPVDFISNEVDAASGTIELRATYDNPQFRLVPGEFVDVNVRLADLNGAMVVPREAVNTGQDGRYIYVVKADSTIEMRSVKVLNESDALMAIDNVKVGEQVVTDGQVNLRPGIAVKILGNELPAKEAPAT